MFLKCTPITSNLDGGGWAYSLIASTLVEIIYICAKFDKVFVPSASKEIPGNTKGYVAKFFKQLISNIT